jgi:hypothetical protein
MTEAARASETLVNFYQTTRRYNPEDSHLLTHRRENFKSYLSTLTNGTPFLVYLQSNYKHRYLVITLFSTTTLILFLPTQSTKYLHSKSSVHHITVSCARNYKIHTEQVSTAVSRLISIRKDTGPENGYRANTGAAT